MVRTRSKAQNEKRNGLENCTTGLPTKARGVLENPSIDGKNQKSSIIKTYSKKRPRRLTSSSKENFLEPYPPDFPSKHDSSVKQKLLIYSCHDSSRDNFDCTSKNLSAGQRILPSSGKATKRSAENILEKFVHKKKRNKTTVSISSMSACTMLHALGKGADIVDQSMSLCSVSNGIVGGDLCGTRQSSTMANYNNADTNFVPDDISVIEGDEDHRTIASYYNEQTPVKQPLQTNVSPKRVKFTITKNGQISKSGQHGNPVVKGSILKTPKQSPHMEGTPLSCPRTSTPIDVNKKPALLQCDLSLLLDNDCPSKVSPTDKNTTGITGNTEKLLEFEPLPLECSKGIPDSCQDFTPETHNPLKISSGSGKERRRLSYNPDKHVLPCILLDLPAVCKREKAPVLFGKSQLWSTIKQMKLTPPDILS